MFVSSREVCLCLFLLQKVVFVSSREVCLCLFLLEKFVCVCFF